MTEQPASDHSTRRLTRARVGIVAPFIVLSVLIAGWTAAWWMFARGVADGVSQWVAVEATQGRVWACDDRSVGGYPFRIEVRCPNLTRNDRAGEIETIALKGLTVVTQVFRPNHQIAELQGPASVRLRDGGRIEADWSTLQASLVQPNGALERASIVVDTLRLDIARNPADSGQATAKRLEAHLRMVAATAPDDASADLALSLRGLESAALTTITRRPEAIDLEVQANASRIGVLTGAPGGVGPVRIDAWRDAGGRIKLALLRLAQAESVFEAKGELALDQQRRPSGRIETTATAPAARFAGLGLGGLMAILPNTPVTRAIDARRPAGPPSPSTAPDTRTLNLTLNLRDGRIVAGVFPVGRIPPLY